MLIRRDIIKGLIVYSSVATSPMRISAAEVDLENFDEELAAYKTDLDAIELSHQYRELDYRDSSITEAQPGIGGHASSRKIHAKAKELIIASEVSGEARYSTKYRQPIWPGGQSGITIGVGYDIGYTNATAFETAWSGILSEQDLRLLKAACRLRGKDAMKELPKFKSIDIEWDQAITQFNRFLPYIIGETEVNFANCDLLSDLSMGALVSLVYNRGSNASKLNNRRKEMYEIKLAMKQGKERFREIPDIIIAMKRLWIGDPSMRGLLRRRELEAELFRAGLQ